MRVVLKDAVVSARIARQMASKRRNKIIPDRVLEIVDKERRKLVASREWKQFCDADEKLHKTAENGHSFDPRFNAVHWAFDVSSLCRQIAFSYIWVNAYAQFYKATVSPGSLPAHTDFYVSYFADNCITRIDSARDKIALLVWSFYCSFNPERPVLDYPKIVERLEHPAEFGLRLIHPLPFLSCLKLLQGQDFHRIERYRHLKIHRREPRIEIYGVAPHHDWSYMFPLTEEKEIVRWEKDLEQLYPDQSLRERVKKGCYLHGTLFEQRKIKDRLWNYSEVEQDLNGCLLKLLNATATCFRVLGKRLTSISRRRSVRRFIQRRKKTPSRFARDGVA
jgi:hypothetical protein